MRWTVFFAVFSALYSGLHLYALWRATQAGFQGASFYAGFLLFMIAMVSIPFLVRFMEMYGYQETARILAFAGFAWMGFIFLFFCTGVFENLVHLVMMGAGRLAGKDASWTLARPHAFFIVLFVSVGIAIYGSFEARFIRTTHVTVKTAKLPREVQRFRIVQISDVHLGVIVREGRLGRMLEAIKSADPDLLVSTGDLVDGQMENRKDLAAMLQSLKTGCGKFAVTGNHEFYAGIGRSLDFIRGSGFTILRGEASNLLPWLSIAGVDDPAGSGIAGKASETEVLSRIPRDHFVLFLKHRPSLDAASAGLFDLQLSGHTHKGQIFPFTLVIKLLFPIDAGLLHLAKGAALYVSPGTGTWGPPIRFLAPPEVTVIDLVR